MTPRNHIFRSGAVCDESCWECRLYDRVLPSAFLLGVLVFLIYFITLGAPIEFPSGSYLKITEGQTVAQVAQVLKDRHIIRSAAVFEGLVRVFAGNRGVFAGEYFF